MKYILLICVLQLSPQAFGQVTGRVVDGSGFPLAYANVLLLNELDRSFAAGTPTGEDGVFELDWNEEGLFFIEISSLGYAKFSSSVFAITGAGSALDLGEITLDMESEALDKVIVRAQKDIVQQSETGKVINVSSSLMTKGSNALQVLERIPGVIVDKRDNQFSLQGQGVAVSINGRSLRMSMEGIMSLLESTPGENIEKVELVTSPNAGFDADGGGGIINIVLKENREQGTNLSLSATAGYGYREKGTLSLGLSKGFDHWKLYSNYAFMHRAGRSGFKGYGTSNQPIFGLESSGSFSNLADLIQNTHNLNLNAEVDLSEHSLLGTDITASFSASEATNYIDNYWDLANEEYIGMKAKSQGINTRNYIISSLYLKNELSERAGLDLDASMILVDNDSPRNISAKYYDRQGVEFKPEYQEFTRGNRGESFSKIGIGVLKLDYSQQLSGGIAGKFGVKGSIAMNSNDSNVKREIDGVWETDPRSQSKINGDEKIFAAYSQFDFQFGVKSSLQAGLRYEYWQRDINIYEENFTITKLFPSFLFIHKIDERINLRLGYSRRIDRPAYSDLISNLFYNDPTAIFTGNPLLKPGISDVVRAEIGRNGFSAGLSWQWDVNSLIRYQLTANEAGNILIVSPQNIDFQRGLNFSLSGPIQLLPFWRINFGSTSAWRKYKISYSVTPAVKSYLFQNFNCTQDLDLPKAFAVELSGWYNFPFYDGTNKIKGFGVVNLGISKTLSGNRGTLQLVFPDLFQTFSVHTDIGGMTRIVYDINTVSTWKDESARYRIFNLTFSRTFGENSGKRHNSENEEHKRIL
ncbi:MAG: TonB-dependent receptor [Saprospiraceae bacterium]|nr:TonB-dependent receptor [Saprospiraceae bacterium]